MHEARYESRSRVTQYPHLESVGNKHTPGTLVAKIFPRRTDACRGSRTLAGAMGQKIEECKGLLEAGMRTTDPPQPTPF